MSFAVCGLTDVVAQAVPNSTGEPEHLTQEILRLESIRLSNHPEFISGLQSIQTSLDQMSAYQVCHFQFLKAYKTAFAGQSQQAVTDMEQIIPLCDDLRARIRLDALIANISAISGDYQKASYHIDNAILNAEQTNDEKSKVIAYSSASIVYGLLDQKKLSVDFSALHHGVAQTNGSQCRLSYSKNLHDLELDGWSYEADQIQDSAASCRASGNDLLAQFIVLDNIKKKLDLGSDDPIILQEVGEVIDSIRKEIAPSSYKNVQARFSAIEAKYAYYTGDNNAAQEHGLKTLELNKELGRTEQLIMALEVLENVANSKADYAKSYEYLNQKNEVELQMYDQSQAKQMAFMTVKHSNLAKVFEIEQLSQQKEVLELEKRLANQETNNQRLVILLILTLLAFMFLWLLKIKRRHDYFKDVSEIDHLTKVLTRKAFEEQVAEKLKQCHDKNNPINIAIMDLDLFKKVNDNHGHLIGDWVLKNVVYTCKELVEEDMIIARLGGEEFCIVMANVECQVMHNKLEKMRKAIETLDCSASGAELSVTASFGYTSSITSGYSLPLLLTHADVALFEAKKQGRNQVVKFNNLRKKNSS